jgi:hypothetical protein
MLMVGKAVVDTGPSAFAKGRLRLSSGVTRGPAGR